MFDVHSTANRFVATKNLFWKSLNCWWYLLSLSSWLILLWIVDGNGRKVLLNEKLGQRNTTLDRFDEDATWLNSSTSSS